MTADDTQVTTTYFPSLVETTTFPAWSEVSNQGSI